MRETFDVTYHGRQALLSAQSDRFIHKTYHHALLQLYILQKMLTSYPHGFSGPQIEIIPWESKGSKNTEQILVRFVVTSSKQICSGVARFYLAPESINHNDRRLI